MRLLYDVSQLEEIASSDGWIGSISMDLGGGNEDSDADEVVEESLSRIKEVEVVVGSEERTMLMLRGLETSILSKRTKVVVRARA